MADRSFGDDLKSTARSRAVRGITGSLFGSGVVGTALKRTLQRKFAEKDVDQEDKVVDALKEQEEVITDNDKTLIRIERIVMNIADNIYNIAGIMNAQVVSMREAERLRQQARSRDVASREEAAFEATREVAPTAAGTETTNPEEGKKGIMSSLIGAVGSTKRMFGAFLKKFGVAALAVTGTLAAATAAIAASRSGSSDEESNTDGETDVASGEGIPTTPPSVSQSDGSYDTAEAARLSRNASTPPPPPPPPASPVQRDDTAGQMMSQFSQMTSQVPGGAAAGQRMAPFMSAMQSDNPIASFIAAAQDDAARNPQPKPVAPPPPPPPPPEPTVVSQPAASAGAAPAKSTADLIQSTKDNIQANNKRLGQRETAYQSRVAHIRKRYVDEPDKMQDMLKNEATGIEQYRQMVNESNAMLESRIKQLEQEGAQAPSTSSVSSGSVSAPAGGGAGMGGGSVGAGAAGGSSGGGSSAPVLPSPSTGADIGSSSVQLAADMRTPSSTSTSPQVMTAENATSSVGGQSPSVIPSPVADRGSLDKNITFDSATN